VAEFWSFGGITLMISTEILSGEVTSRKAKLVLYPLLLIYLFDFVAMVVRLEMTGYSGFRYGTPDGAGYSVVEHGHTIHLTAGQYWLGRIHLLSLFLGLLAWFIARAYLFRTGDLRREKKRA
jgi:hypothetical protein